MGGQWDYPEPMTMVLQHDIMGKVRAFLGFTLNQSARARAPRKISAYGMMIGIHGRGTARLFDPRPLIEAV
jgi:hypothetical protein